MPGPAPDPLDAGYVALPNIQRKGITIAVIPPPPIYALRAAYTATAPTLQTIQTALFADGPVTSLLSYRYQQYAPLAQLSPYGPGWKLGVRILSLQTTLQTSLQTSLQTRWL
jgi:hypothetical protein